MKKLVAIVDAYSAANQYAPYFRSHGYRCVHVQSSAQIPDFYSASFRPEDFEQNLISTPQTAATLKFLEVSSVIAGAETGVNLADELSEALELPTNGTRLSCARRNKYEMAQAIASRGIRTIPQFASDSLAEILAWQREARVQPIVLKPPMSAGTDQVFVCDNEAQVENAFRQILGARNLLGLMNAQVLAQQLVRGTEYVVNMVSCQGKRRLTEIWRYTKIAANGGNFLYDRDDLLDSEGTLQDELVAYTAKVLDALEIDYGPSHAEVYVTAEGPVLMEVAARIDGFSRGAHLEMCTGTNPIELVMDSFLNPEKFLAEFIPRYRLSKRACTVSMISHDEGLIESMPGLDELETLESLSLLGLRVASGGRINRTVDTATLPGIAYLQHEESSVIERDYTRIRQLERSGLFEIR